MSFYLTRGQKSLSKINITAIIVQDKREVAMIEAWLEKAVGVVWNYPVVGLCLFSGLFFTLRMSFVQLRCLPHALMLLWGKYDNPKEKGEITHFQALSAALSGTIGLGNIAGVAVAIAMGGPGAVLWMWVVAFFGMATKFVECALGTIYRDIDADGRCHGGPMHYITKGLGPQWKPMAVFFAICCAIGCFGFANMFQGNQVAAALNRYYGVPDWVVGFVLTFGVGLTIIGGIHRIGAVAGKIVPFMCVSYVVAALFVCFVNIDKLPMAFALIISDAFTGQAAAGGVVGSVIIIGVRRAVFSNEAGLGSAPIAHAAVKTDYPIREGIVASVGPLIDTILVCSATAAVIILAGNFGTERFEAIDAVSLSSPLPSSLKLGNGWALRDTEIPPAHSRLQSFRDSHTALAFTGTEASSTRTAPLKVYQAPGKALIEKNLRNGRRHVADGLRFSCHHPHSSAHYVEVLDQTGAVVGRLPVSPDGGTYSAVPKTGGEAVPWMHISPCSQDGEWHSHVIEFTPAFQRKIRRGAERLGSLQLNFDAQAGGGAWYIDRPQAVKGLTGIDLTSASFDTFFQGFGGFFISLAVCFFSYSTMVTWFYYGETAVLYVFGPRIILPFRLAYCSVAFLGCIVQLSVVLSFSDLMSGLMVIPNTIAILLLSPVVVKESQRYFKRLRKGEFTPAKEPASTQSII